MKSFLVPLRRLRRTPAFTLITILTLAIGLGAVTAAFSLVQNVLLQPLPYRNADELVRVLAFDNQEGQVEWLSWAEAVALRSGNRALQEVAVSTVFPATLKTDEGSVRLERGFVSFNYFSLLGVDPVLGNLFLEDDPQQVLISHRWWRQKWSGRTDVLNRTLELDGQLYTVVGVLPPTVYTHDLGSLEADVWLPQSFDRTASDPHFRIYTVVARLRDGATGNQARQQLEAAQVRLAAQQPAIYDGWGAHVDSLHAAVVGDSGRGLVLLLAAVCLILLIVSVNLANLMMTRFASREREIATRLALGDNRLGILQDATVEGGILALAGGALGTLMSMLLLQAIPTLLPFALPRLNEISASFQMLAVAIIAGAVTTILFALVPALMAVRYDLANALREGGRGAGSSLGGIRKGAIVAQVALSIPLLVGAGLLGQSLLHLQQRSLGLHPDGIFTLRISVPFSQYRRASDRVQYFNELLRGVRALPGVEGAGATLQVPFVAHQADRTRFHLAETDLRPVEEHPRALLQVVSEGYFETLRTRLLEGRLFDSRDNLEGAPVMIINEELRRRELGGRSALGVRLETEMMIPDDQAKVRQVIGVVEDIPHFGPRNEPEPQIFIPHQQSSWPSMGVVVRTRLPSSQSAASIRELALELERDAIVEEATELRSALDATLGQPRFYSQLLIIFAFTATLLATLGLYGLLSYAVASRRPELGLRAALGASPASLLLLVIRGGVGLTAAGVVIGLLLSAAVVQSLRTQLYGVDAFDLTTFALAAIVVLLFSLLASTLPGRRAAALDPVEALRGD